MIYTSNVVTTQPAIEPVTLAQLKAHLRIDHDNDDAMVASFGMTARVMAERYLNRALINTTFLYTLQPDMPTGQWGWEHGPWRWRAPIELPRSPLVSLSSVTINDVLGNATVVSPSALIVEASTDPARVKINYATGLVSPVAALKDIQIAYTAGYGTTAVGVPQSIISAILITTAYLYEHRGDDGGELPQAIKWLLDMDRVHYAGG